MQPQTGDRCSLLIKSRRVNPSIIYPQVNAQGEGRANTAARQRVSAAQIGRIFIMFGVPGMTWTWMNELEDFSFFTKCILVFIWCIIISLSWYYTVAITSNVYLAKKLLISPKHFVSRVSNKALAQIHVKVSETSCLWCRCWHLPCAFSASQRRRMS